MSKRNPTFTHCHVEIRQGGRQNAKHHIVCMGGRVVYAPAQDGIKANAYRLAARIERLVARWNAVAS